MPIINFNTSNIFDLHKFWLIPQLCWWKSCFNFWFHPLYHIQTAYSWKMMLTYNALNIFGLSPLRPNFPSLGPQSFCNNWILNWSPVACCSMLAMIHGRFGKSTHISMISNSYTSAELYQLRNRRKLHADIAGNSARSPTSLHRAPISSHRMTSARLPTSLLQTQTSPHRAPTSPHRAPISLHRMRSVSWCFTMF